MYRVGSLMAQKLTAFIKVHTWTHKRSGPSCSKLTTSLVNDSLKFTSSDTQIC